MPKWTEQFNPEFAVPSEVLALVGKEIEDLSYVNDTCPSFGLVDVPTGERAELFCGHPDLAKRELTHKRFFVLYSDKNGNCNMVGDYTDDLAEALGTWRGLVRKCGLQMPKRR